jgi:mycothiol system anti-sigma-R factor
MDCDQILFHAAAHFQGQLTWWRSVIISRHLDGCPDCQQNYNRQIAYRAVITTKCQEQVPPHLETRITEALLAPFPIDTDTQW